MSAAAHWTRLARAPSRAAAAARQLALRTETEAISGNGTTSASAAAAALAAATAAANTIAAKHGCHVARASRVDELGITVFALALPAASAANGAQVLHLVPDAARVPDVAAVSKDSRRSGPQHNPVCSSFGVSFATPVNDDAGLPHVLEHLVLCGSEAFPVRDPFFAMTSRSVASFMNAMTFDDYTLYPFSSSNHADFNNLLRVYLDAVFRPRLDPLDFAQEAWRLAPRSLSSTDQNAFGLQGVVYNEMKGWYSDPNSVFCMHLQKNLYPGSRYAYNSGGDPLYIPQLTVERLRSYHAQRYALSKAAFYSYGCLENTLNSVLQEINAMKNSLQSKKTATVSEPEDPELVLPEAVKEPVQVRVTCTPDATDDPEKKNIRMAIAFATNESSNAFETFCMRILADLLLEGTSSPMHRALIESGLAQEYAPGTGYDSGMSRAMFAVGAQGATEGSLEKIESTIWNVLQEVAEKGFEKQKVFAVLNQCELGLRHVSPGIGLSLLQTLARRTMQSAKLPEESLQIALHCAKLRKNPELLVELLRKYILNNKQRVHLIMSPSNTHSEKESSKEEKQVALLAPKSESEKSSLTRVCKELEERQMACRNASCLPCLELTDLPEEPREYPITLHSQLPTVFHRETKTNGITYVSSKISLPGDQKRQAVVTEYLNHLPLLAGALTWQGTKTREMAKIELDIRANTGGISFSPYCHTDTSDLKISDLGLAVSGNSLTTNLDHLLRLSNELLYYTNFDDEARLRVLLENTIVSFSNSLAYSGHEYAGSLAASAIDDASRIHDSWNGIGQLEFLQKEARKKSMRALVERLISLHGALVKSNVSTTFVVTHKSDEVANRSSPVDKVVLSKAAGNPSYTPNGVSKSAKAFVDYHSDSLARHVVVPTPFLVGFAASAVRGVAYKHPDSMALSVAAKLLTQGFLHPEVRERGGAYGGSALYSALNGVFTMRSYRDPNHFNTPATFEKGLQWLAGIAQSSENHGSQRAPPTEQQVKEAKLSVFAGLDAPLDAAAEGSLEFSHGVGIETVRERRAKLRGLTLDNIREAVFKHLLQSKRKATAVLAPKASLKEYLAAGYTERRLSDSDSGSGSDENNNTPS